MELAIDYDLGYLVLLDDIYVKIRNFGNERSDFF